MAITQEADFDLLVGPEKTNRVAKRTGVDNLAVVDRDHDVAFLHPGIGCSRIGNHLGDYGATGRINPKRFGKFRGQVLRNNAQTPAADLSVFNDLAGEQLNHVDRYGKSDADIAAPGCQDRGVDANQFATKIDERTTRVALVD